MDRKRPIAVDPKVGKTRGKLYRHLIDRYHTALNDGYLLEAISLIESIISDRLTSYIISTNHKVHRKTRQFLTIGDCLSYLKTDEDFPIEIRQKISLWKDQRNEALHEMAKFSEGEFPEFNLKYQSFKDTAYEGETIFRIVNKYVRLYYSKKKE